MKIARWLLVGYLVFLALSHLVQLGVESAHLVGINGGAGVSLLVLVGMIAIAALLTEDFACLGAGLLVAQGRIGFLAATFACFVGIVVGNVLLYWAGRYLGRSWLPRAPLKSTAPRAGSSGGETWSFFLLALFPEPGLPPTSRPAC